MYIDFGRRTEKYECHSIFDEYDGGYSLTINNDTFRCEDFNMVKTVYDDIVNALQARKIIYFVDYNSDTFIEKRYNEIVNAREIAAKKIDKLIREKLKYNRENKNDK